MKKSYLKQLQYILSAIILALLFCPHISSASVINVPTNFLAANSGLVGWWTFDGANMISNVADTSGQGNNGFLSNAVPTTTVPGMIGQALSFDGANQSVSLLASPISNYSNPNTECFWYNALDYGSGYSIFNFETGTPNDAWLNINSSGQIFYDYTAAGVDYGHAFVDFLSTGQWVYLCTFFDGSSIGMYSNGVLQSYYPTIFGSSLETGDVIGGRLGASPFHGKIDDFRVYNRLLSATEIAALYNANAVKTNHGSLVKAKVAMSSSPGSLNNGLVGWWTFDGPKMLQNVTDSSGNGNSGFLYNQTSTTTVIGKIGQALKFDGVDDYVDAGDINALDGLGVISASAWIRTRDANSMTLEKHFVDKSQCEGALNGGVFELVGGILAHKVEFTIYNNGGSPNYYTSGWSSTSVDDTNWHLVTGVYDGNTLYIYVDGKLENSASVVGAIMPSTSDKVQIGGQCNGNGPIDQYFLASSIDDVRVYNRALSAGEISQLYRASR